MRSRLTGRTPDFDSGNAGSTPASATDIIYDDGLTEKPNVGDRVEEFREVRFSMAGKDELSPVLGHTWRGKDGRYHSSINIFGSLFYLSGDTYEELMKKILANPGKLLQTMNMMYQPVRARECARGKSPAENNA